MIAAALVWTGVLAGGGVLEAQNPGGSKTMLALPPSPLLPGTLGKLSRVSEGDAGDGLGALSDSAFNPTDRAVLLEDGIKRYAVSAYAPEGKPDQPAGTITVYKFGDASGAMAAYDFFRRPGVARVNAKLADQVASDGKGVLLRSGVNVVRLDMASHGEPFDALIKELVDRLPKVGGPASIAPLLPTLLPQKGLDADSAKYALGPAGYGAEGGALPPQTAGFDKSAETITARYKGQGSLTLALYPTPQIAGEHARSAQTDLKNQGASAGTVMLRREGPLVIFTTGEWKPEAAKAMVEGVHLRQELSFDKPMPHEFHAEVQKTYSLLQSIAIFCVFGALAAICLGLFLGGGRALIRVMQGKPAATEPEFLRIDLRGAVTEIHHDPGAS